MDIPNFWQKYIGLPVFFIQIESCNRIIIFIFKFKLFSIIIKFTANTMHQLQLFKKFKKYKVLVVNILVRLIE